MANNGAYHLADNPELYEPQRQNNFRFIITDLDDLVKAGIPEDLVDDDTDIIVNGQEYLELSVISVDRPNLSIGTISVSKGNTQVKYAGTPTFNDLSLKINDYIGARTYSILLAWQAQVFDINSEAIYRSDNYKKTAFLYEYTPDYKTIVRSWRLEGCWISSLDDDGFSNESQGSKMTITATIVFDKAYPIDEEQESA